MCRFRVTDDGYAGRKKRIEVGSGGRAPRQPARPVKPELVSPKEVPPPEALQLSKAAYLLHNLAHIELNAVDLAWDTLVYGNSMEIVRANRSFLAGAVFGS